MTSINDIGKKRGRGRPKTDALPVMVRLLPAQVSALDAFIAAKPDPKPSRPEAIRRIVAERLQPTAALSPATVIAKGDDARSVAGHAADRAMTGMDAAPEVKAQRRRALTNEPAAVAKTRAKRAAVKPAPPVVPDHAAREVKAQAKRDAERRNEAERRGRR